MSKSEKPAMPLAYYDFYKTNGSNTAVYNDGPSMTRQEFADEADINNIMARFERTGVLPVPNVEPMYFDFTAKPGTLMDTMNFLGEAEAEFMRLPANVRKEFDNNAYAFVDYASDPRNLEQMRKWGLAAPAEVPSAHPSVASSSGEPAGGAPAGAPPAPVEPVSTHST